MRVLSLFSGIGSHDYGFELAGWKIVGQVEIDGFCQKVLEKHFPKAAKWTDIHSVTAADIRARCGRIDVITGGFPCQDISTAGKQAGLVDGHRSSLYWEMWRLIRDLKPPIIVLENVPALRTKGADNVFASLEMLDYALWAGVVGAVHAGAPHIRKRVLIVGYSASFATKQAARRERDAAQASEPFDPSFIRNPGRKRLQRGGVPSGHEQEIAEPTYPSFVLDASIEGVGELATGHPRKHLPNVERAGFAFPAGPRERQFDWEEPRTIKPPLGGATDGAARRLARRRANQLRALGNGNPPQIFYLIAMAINEVIKGERS